MASSVGINPHKQIEFILSLLDRKIEVTAFEFRIKS